MTDIVERLRAAKLGQGWAFSYFEEAADEIERLNLVVENGKHWEREHLKEIERLRAALKRAADDLDENGLPVEARQARRALEGK